MVLKLRQVHDIEPIYLEKDDTLSVRYIAQKTGLLQKLGLSSTETILMTEVIGHEGIVNRIISADIVVNDEFRGVAVFVGNNINPEDCGIEIEDEDDR